MKDSQKLVISNLEFWLAKMKEEFPLVHAIDKFEIAIELTKLQYQKELNQKFPLEVDVCINQDSR